MVSEPTITIKEAAKIVEKVMHKYDEEDKYYLAHNDCSGTLITYVQLKDDDFDEWTDTIKLSLESKN